MLVHCSTQLWLLQILLPSGRASHWREEWNSHINLSYIISGRAGKEAMLRGITDIVRGDEIVDTTGGGDPYCYRHGHLWMSQMKSEFY